MCCQHAESEKVTVNSRYYREQRACICSYFDNVQISDNIKTDLPSHGLGHIQLIVWSEQVRWIIRALQTSTMELFAKGVSCVNVKTLTILVKRSILDGLSPEYISPDGYKTDRIIETELSPWQQIKMESFNQLFPFEI